MAAFALLVMIILIVVGVHSCQVSATNSALRNYSVSVSTIIQRSDENGARLFTLLSQSKGTNNAPSLQNQVDESRLAAQSQLGQAEGFSVPDQVSQAQTNLVMALRMRADGIADIGEQLQPALQRQTSGGAVTRIAGDMARFYASDVVYKDYTLPVIVRELTKAGIEVGGTNGEPINEGQFLPSLQWLQPSVVASALQVSAPAGTGPIAPGPHGHKLNTVSVGGNALQEGSTNTLTASPTPTFTLNFTNTGANTETNVTCKVTVTNSSGSTVASGQTVVPQTSSGQSYNCQVTLTTTPPKGSATVTATIERVPGEKSVVRNTQTFPVTFQ
ncbi:MAG TPA: hypothetical protein VKU35_03120 [Candidatus Limnocylindria bacterium]|nr:hypothetical protein [Candidatus Limnocylindria bacterium]